MPPRAMGVVAIGDSLVDADESWAHWLSRAMGQPLHRVSRGGARSADVVGRLTQLDGKRYAVACLSVGTNDILFDWDPDRFAANVAIIVAAARASADHVVAQTISHALSSFPGSGSAFRSRVRQANAVLSGSGALMVAGDDLRGPRLMAADRIHPTGAGQLVLADRAAELLGLAPLPSSLDDETRAVARWAYYRVAAAQVPRRLAKRALGRPMYAAPEAAEHNFPGR